MKPFALRFLNIMAASVLILGVAFLAVLSADQVNASSIDATVQRAPNPPSIGPILSIINAHETLLLTSSGTTAVFLPLVIR
jgi:hypothetical protein